MSIQTVFKRSRKFLLLSVWLALAVGFVVMLSSSIVSQRSKACKDLCIKIDHYTGLFFIDEVDVQNAILDYCGDSLKGMDLHQINFAQIEERLEQNPFIQNAEVYANIRGSINVEIKQREPLMRVVNNKGVSYYIDLFGEKMPVSPKFTARVAVATGVGDGEKESAVLKDLYTLGKYINAHEFWKAQIEQIYVVNDHEFELIPKLADHVIKFGGVENMEGKFEKLMVFYKEILKNVRADDYSVINVKYKDQIVCTKS